MSEHPEQPDTQNDASREPEGAPRGVHAMALVRWVLVAAMAVAAVLSVAYAFGKAGFGEDSSAEGTQYYCPMHPQVVQNGPGECPICSMNLVPKSADRTASKAGAKAKPDDGKDHAGHRHNPSDPYICPMHPEETGDEPSDRCPLCGMKLEKRSAASTEPAQGVPGLVPVELSMDRVQLIGVKTAPAVREQLSGALRTVGFVSADESKLARVHTRFSGWVEALAVSTTGQKVKRGQVLASIYNTELLPAQQEFLAARRWSTAGPADAGELRPSLEQDARARLEILGMSPAEIDRIAESGKPSRTIAITAPISGHVVAKGAVRGAFVQPGTELFEIADLSKVWVLADLYEHEMSRVKLGQSATVELAGRVGKPLEGKVGFIYPVVDPSTRTLRIRVELDNKAQELRPGMYANVSLDLEDQQGVVIPLGGLVDTGDHQYVFVAKEGGRFEPRLVSVGARAGDKVQIVRGLSEGETVVTTANFLIDSESRLRATIEGAPQATSSDSTQGAPGHAGH